MKNQKKLCRKRSFCVVFLLLTSLFCSKTQLQAQAIDVRNQGCRYSINIPTNWDTIPAAQLREKLPQMVLDAGMFPAAQETCFSDKYLLFGFAPTMNALSDFSLEQIASDIRLMNSQVNFVSDTLSLTLDSMVVATNADQYWVSSYQTIRKDTLLLHSCQTMLVTKFGYITLLAYQKEDSMAAADFADKLLKENLIAIDDDYKYVQPQPKTISGVHLFLSLCIGVVVFVVISVFSKFRKK